MNKKYISIIVIFTYLTSLTSASYAGLWDDIKQGTRDATEIKEFVEDMLPQKEGNTQRNEPPAQKDETPVQNNEPAAQKNKAVADKNTTRAQHAYNQDALLVKDVQKELARIGYPVSVDGAYGPGTRKAILKFEADSGRVQTGNISPELFAALRETQPTPSPDARTGKSDSAEQQPSFARVTTNLNNTGQVEGGTSKQDAIDQWEIAIFLEHEGRFGVLGAGGAILDEKGVPTQLAISYDLLQSGARLLISKGRTYIGTGNQATQWVDFSDPIGRLLSSIPVPTIQPGSGDYRETGGHAYGSEQYRVYERKGKTVKIDDVKYTTKDAYWKDVSGEIRRYVTTVQIQTGNDVVSLISVADRVARVALPGWYSGETFRARRNAIPAAAASRAMMRTSQNTRAPVAQLPFFGSHFSDHQPILSPPFSVSGLFTPVVDLLIPRAHAGDLKDKILEKLIEKLPQPGAGLEGYLDKILAGEDIGKEFVRDEVIKLLEGELEDALKKAVEAGLVRLFPPFGFLGLGGLAADLIVPPAADFIKAKVYGEPHIHAFDSSSSYVFSAVGEFIQVKTPTFMVQQRFMGTKGMNTIAKATAVQAGDHVIESYMNKQLRRSDPVSVVVDGALVEVGYEGISFDDGTYIAQRRVGGELQANKLIVVDPGGSYVLIENYRNSQSISISLTDETKRQVSGGLSGIPDGNTANDFTLRDGNVMALDETRTIEGLYGRFATSWRVRPEERLFTQGNAEDYLTAEYTEIPRTITRLSDFSQAELDRAAKICTDAGVSAGPALEDCTYDVVVTGDPEWAQMASSSEVVAAAQPPQAASGGTQFEPAQATPLTSVAIKARIAGGSLASNNLQWTIINQSTEEMVVPEMQSTTISVELDPGNYDVLVVADGYEGESTIKVQASGPNQFVVELQARGGQDGFSSPESVPAGELMSFEWKGPAAKDDRIFIGKLDMNENQYRMRNYHKASVGSPAVLVAPSQPGPYEVRYFSYANGSVAFRKSLEVTAAEVQINAPGELTAGTEFTFDWNGPSAKGDLLFVAKPETDASKYHSDTDLSHKVSAGAPANLIAPPKAGDYEIRYYSYANGHTLASSPIRVLPHAVSIDAPRTVAPGNEFGFSWEGPGARGDFMFLCEAKMEESKYYSGADRQHRVKDGATGKLTAPTNPGTYEIRYFSYRNGSVLAKRVFIVR